MRSPNRSLALEAVEDRSVPSAYFQMFQMPAGYAASSSAHELRAAGLVRYESYLQVRAFTNDGIVFRIRFEEPVFIYRLPSSSNFERTDVFVGSNPQTNTDNGRFDSAAQTSSSSGGSEGPIAPQPRATTTPRAPAADAAPGTGNVAMALPAQAANALPASVDQSGTSAARVAAAQNPPAFLPGGQIFTGHGAGYANTATLGSDDGVVPPADAMPDVPPTPAPTPMPESGAGTVLVQAAAAVAGPVAGALAIDLSALKVGTSQFLGRVADLSTAWPDDMPGLSDSLWIGAATLLAGGAVYAAANRPAPRPTRDPFRTGTGLSDWEPRNAGQAG